MGSKNRAKAQAYRQSDKGRQARRMYLAQPEVKARMSVRRAVKRKLKKGY